MEAFQLSKMTWPPSIEGNLVVMKRGTLQKTSEDSHHSKGSKFKRLEFHAKKLARPQSFQNLEMVAKSRSNMALFDILWQVSKLNYSFSRKFWKNLKLAQ